MNAPTPTPERDLIEQARRFQPDVESLLDALEATYLHGFADGQAGDVDESPSGHCYRVDRWLVWTDTQGFHAIDDRGDEESARAALDAYAVECGDVECGYCGGHTTNTSKCDSCGIEP